MGPESWKQVWRGQRGSGNAERISGAGPQARAARFRVSSDAGADEGMREGHTALGPLRGGVFLLLLILGRRFLLAIDPQKFQSSRSSGAIMHL